MCTDYTFIYDGGILMGITEAFAAIRATWGGLTTALETKQAVDLNTVKLAMSDQLLKLYDAAFSLQEAKTTAEAEKRKLEDELMELRKKADERDQYELFDPRPGTTVMRRKHVDDASEAGKYVCPGCLMNRGITSILQFSPRLITGACHECKASYRFLDDPPLHYPGTAHERY